MSGATDEPAKLTINGQKVETDAENEFETFVTSSGGTTLLSILTEDYNGNVAASPRQWTFASTGTVGGSFAYNGGNLAGQNYPRPAQYTWDAEDRLKTATVDGHTYEFAYDAFGRRVREKVDGTATRTWVWDGMAIVEERSADGATVRKRFYPQGEQWVGGTKAGKYYYTFDHLGSIREMTDASRNVVARYAYAPYGEATKTQGDLDASFTYTGHFAHGGSGLLLAPYRAYDPALGRWLSRDPIGESGGINLYGYVFNDPINAIDPLGLDAYFGYNPEHAWAAVDTPRGNVARMDYQLDGYTGRTGNDVDDAFDNFSGKGAVSITMGKNIGSVTRAIDTVYRIPQTREQDLKVFKRMMEKLFNPPNYNLLVSNCGQQAADVLNSKSNQATMGAFTGRLMGISPESFGKSAQGAYGLPIISPRVIPK